MYFELCPGNQNSFGVFRTVWTWNCLVTAPQAAKFYNSYVRHINKFSKSAVTRLLSKMGRDVGKFPLTDFIDKFSRPFTKKLCASANLWLHCHFSIWSFSTPPNIWRELSNNMADACALLSIIFANSLQSSLM